MPSSVHSQDNDQSMVDAQNQEHEQTEQQQQEQEQALEEKRIVVVRGPSLATSWTVADRTGLDRIGFH